MTSGRQNRPGHHLFWSTPNGRLIHYHARGRPNRLPISRGLSIWKLRRRFPALVDWLSRERSLRAGLSSDLPSGAALSALSPIDGLDPNTPAEWRKRLVGILMLGPQNGLARVAEGLPQIGRLLTPHYRLMFATLAGSFKSSVDLTFLACQPNIYLWLPPGSGGCSRVLICFCTSSNSLNAPLPVAHAALATSGIPICYVFNGKKRPVHNGLPGQDTDQSGRVLSAILNRLGLTERYGLGTSLGGYTVCRYASALRLNRVLNFSGWPNKDSELWSNSNCLSEALGDFPRERVLSVLSRTDPNDQAILQSYDKDPLSTPRFFLETPTHGSLLAAIIENRLAELLAWLLEGKPIDGMTTHLA